MTLLAKPYGKGRFEMELASKLEVGASEAEVRYQSGVQTTDWPNGYIDSTTRTKDQGASEGTRP
jgi:hypothetical protein